MAQKSEIEWTDATWNPVTGCTKVGPGCDNCYAERFAERWRGIEGHPYEQGFDLRLWPSRLQQPVLWKRPRMIFVNSMSDLFHKEINRQFIDLVFDTMEHANWHVYQVLTKRSSLMRNYIRKRYDGGRVPNHIWLGVSVEDAAACQPHSAFEAGQFGGTLHLVRAALGADRGGGPARHRMGHRRR